jgi:hypothetical protein
LLQHFAKIVDRSQKEYGYDICRKDPKQEAQIDLGTEYITKNLGRKILVDALKLTQLDKSNIKDSFRDGSGITYRFPHERGLNGPLSS